MGSAGRSIAALTIAALVVLSIPIVLANSNPYDPARQRYRPLIGGIQIEIMTPSLRPYGNCTIGYVARDRNGNLGIVTAGHCVNFRTDYVAYQPNYDIRGSNRIGTPTIVDRYSDSAFIPFNNVAPWILNITYISNKYVGVMMLVNEISSWDFVDYYITTRGLFYKTGRTTGTTSGHILYKCDYCIELINGNVFVFYRLLITNIYAERGDSGAPLYTYVCIWENYCWLALFGHLSFIEEYNGSRYSGFIHVSSVMERLGVMPIIVDVWPPFI